MHARRPDNAERGHWRLTVSPSGSSRLDARGDSGDRRGRLAFLGAYSVLRHEVIERRARHTEQLGGARDIAPGTYERRADRDAFSAFWRTTRRFSVGGFTATLSPKSAAVTSLPSAMMTAALSLFSISRTLPGHA